MIDAGQIRAARAFLEWSQTELGEKAGLSPQTIKRMEALGPGRSSMDNVAAVQSALESAGVVFLPDDGAGIGLRFSAG